MYLFADDEPIPFSLDDKEYSQQCDTLIDAREKQYSSITFRAEKDVSIYNIVCVYFPEDIPNKGSGEYSGIITYTIFNKECNSDNKNDQSEIKKNYVEVEPIKNNFGTDIGTLSIADNDQKVVENHFYDDVELSPEKELYLKFNCGSEVEMPSYYLLLLIDGKLTKAFGDDELIYVDCQSGTRSFEYAVNKDLLPKEGLHTFQLVAVPSANGNNFSSFSTDKVRVNIQN